jgi:hypothetical protein
MSDGGNPMDFFAAAAKAMLGKQEQQEQQQQGATIAMSEDNESGDDRQHARRQREVVSSSPTGDDDDDDTTRSASSPSFNPRAVEDLLRREMEQLSAIEKENIEDEIHGYMTKSPLWENKDVEYESLKRMEIEIEQLPSTKKKAYEHALRLGSQYVYDQPFRMKFLRTENFDAHAASIRFCKWLDMLQDYYGDFALMRPLYMTDLGKDELRLLRLGTLQILPTRDRAGRRVAMMIGSMGGDKFSVYCRVRIFWFAVGSKYFVLLVRVFCDGNNSLLVPSTNTFYFSDNRSNWR